MQQKIKKIINKKNKSKIICLTSYSKNVAEAIDPYADIILMNIESPVPNHAAIYLGENVILHHVTNRLSSRDVYKWGGYYHKMTAKVLRHESR